jgi:hypothetical protein
VRFEPAWLAARDIEVRRIREPFSDLVDGQRWMAHDQRR